MRPAKLASFPLDTKAAAVLARPPFGRRGRSPRPPRCQSSSSSPDDEEEEEDQEEEDLWGAVRPRGCARVPSLPQVGGGGRLDTMCSTIAKTAQRKNALSVVSAAAAAARLAAAVGQPARR
eukprot:SAG31_NODE_7736_length_1606_cov_1.401460_2_plen_121_part_00